MERHKTRLNAEFTKARLRRGCTSVDELRAHVAKTAIEADESKIQEADAQNRPAKSWPRPRWVRVNILRTSVEEQLKTTFAGFQTVTAIEEVMMASASAKVLYLDENIPNLLALPPLMDLSTSSAYLDGSIILQDKASCFPAYLLDPEAEDGDCVDACAAPGNKTTHLAAILDEQSAKSPMIYACERDKSRASTLSRMVSTAHAERQVKVQRTRDFLKFDFTRHPWSTVGCLLVDPSCSGSGIVGRDDFVPITLPGQQSYTESHIDPKKRKRKKAEPAPLTTPALSAGLEETPIDTEKSSDQIASRLKALSAFQLRLLLHALQFPKARKISYSTCSIHAEENEHVVARALASSHARETGWRLLQRSEQVSGMKAWPIRGDVTALETSACLGTRDAKQLADACIRCEKGTKEGTQGFFVACFVRDVRDRNRDGDDDDEWAGFSDDERTD